MYQFLVSYSWAQHRYFKWTMEALCSQTVTWLAGSFYLYNNTICQKNIKLCAETTSHYLLMIFKAWSSFRAAQMLSPTWNKGNFRHNKPKDEKGKWLQLGVLQFLISPGFPPATSRLNFPSQSKIIFFLLKDHDIYTKQCWGSNFFFMIPAKRWK